MPNWIKTNVSILMYFECYVDIHLMRTDTRPLTVVADAWANKDASGFELLELIISDAWWFVEVEVDAFVGDCILRNPVVPFVSVVLWFIGVRASRVKDGGVGNIESCWDTDLLCFFVLEDVVLLALLAVNIAVGVVWDCCWVAGWGVIDLCCFSICSSVWAAGCDINRASKGLLSFVTVPPGVGWSAALKCPVLT